MEPIKICTVRVRGFVSPETRDTVSWDPDTGMLVSEMDDGRPIEYPVSYACVDRAVAACADKWAGDPALALQWIKA